MTIAKSVYRIQFFLIESSSCSAVQLFTAGSVLSRPDYEDVVVERSIAGLCGYPPCANELPTNRERRGRFRVSLSEHRVYDLEETYNYCCDACVVNSRAFTRSLNAERVSDLNEAKIEQVLLLFGHSNAGEEVFEGRDLGIKSLTIKEKEGAGAGVVSLEEWIGPGNAIEGYVPKRDRIGVSGSNVAGQNYSGKMTEVTGDSGIPFASDGSHSIIHFSAIHDVSEPILKNTQAASSAKKKVKSKRSTSKTSNIELKKHSEDSESCNMDFSTSLIEGNEFGDCNTSFPTGQDISDMITKQLENIVLQEKKTGKSTELSLSSKFKHYHKSKDATNETFDHTNTMNVRGKDGTLSGNVSFTAENALEALTRNVENSVEHQTGKKISKLSKPKTKKKKFMNNNCKLIIESFESARDSDDLLSSSHPSSEVLSKKTNGGVGDACLRKESEIKVTNISHYGISSEMEASVNGPKTKSVEKLFKSSLKTSGSKAGSHAVRWADEENGILEDKTIILQESSREDFVNSARFTSAEACAAALTQAAESIASGKIEAEEAATEAGILILPQSQSSQVERESSDDFLKLEHGVVKWPKKTVLLETDMFEVEDSWHDTAPEGFSLNLSPFATMWMALFGWINCSSLAYIYGYDDSSEENFVLVNGKEYPRKVILNDGQSLEIRQTLDGFICRILPVLVKDQRLPVPVSSIEKFLGCLLHTMSFMDAIPSFKNRQWHVIVFLFIEALSVHRLPVLAPHLLSSGAVYQQMLSSAQISNEEYQIMRDLILPFGKSAKFSI